ncbi:MAG TPA: hypothetical protein VM925_01880 [Labilithrix sp.]|nr:hypothetical protein [Labilithrix sp.]
MMIGRIDEVDGHFVATKFVGLLVPTESMYFAHRNGRSTSSEASAGVRIQRDWRSIALGYGRVWLPVVALALPIARACVGPVHATTWIVSAAFLGISLAAHRGGRLAEAEKAKLRLLGSVTGLRIDPERLRSSTRDVKRDSLGDLMEKGGIPMTPEGILSVLDDIPMPAMPLVYGYARYAGEDPAWRHCAELVYQRYQQGDM